jgi:predicted deacetylase
MNWAVWRSVEQALLELDVKPIVAVVPDNQDAALKVGEENKNFWDDVRAWQERGWTIGLHGYQHVYATEDAGLLGVNRFSEFSGVPYAEQRRKLECALEVFQREQVATNLWVAPGHSFDETTLKVLRELGIGSLSDGHFLYSRVDAQGMMWIPQQLWRFRRMPLGVWTVCLHINQWTAGEVDRFQRDLREFRDVVTDVPAELARARENGHSGMEGLLNSTFQILFRSGRWLRDMRGDGFALC